MLAFRIMMAVGEMWINSIIIIIMFYLSLSSLMPLVLMVTMIVYLLVSSYNHYHQKQLHIAIMI